MPLVAGNERIWHSSREVMGVGIVEDLEVTSIAKYLKREREREKGK